MVNHPYRADVGVLGAGIMGCCLALELAQQGFKIDLIDLAPAHSLRRLFRPASRE